MKVCETVAFTNEGRAIVRRSPVAGDAADLLAFLRQLHRESYRFLNRAADKYDAMSVAEEAEILAQFEAHPTSFMVVAAHEGRIVGHLGVFAEASPFQEHCGRLGMGLLATYQGQGIGKALLRHALQEAERFGLWNMRLYVRTYNEPAIRLYESMGFERVGTLQAIAWIDGEWVDDHLYQRRAAGV
ncbi:MAG TPA: GNAT family N-acetyltransferase [Pantanalinema sp.]